MSDSLDEILDIAFPERTNVKHIVVLIHGIRTDAPWFGKVKSILKEEDPSIFCCYAGYEFLDIFRFLTPFFRRNKVEKVADQIKKLKEIYPNSKVSIIAHSFGTYIFSEILKKEEIDFYRVILCGSIVSLNFNWGEYIDKVTSEPRIILNDCGTLDIYPLMAGFFTYGYGASGSVGITKVFVEDRFHKLGHSGFFEDKFIKKYWVPFILYGKLVYSSIDSKRETTSWFKSIMTITPLWNIAIALALLYFVFHLFF